MPYADVSRRKQANREWHKMPAADGRCEATTKAGSRCRWRGWWDGLHGKVLCNLHAREA